MPTVIDSLVITLGLDPRNFNQQQKDAIKHLRDFENEATRAGKNIESQGKKTQEFFSGLKREATVLLGTFLGGRGIKEFVSFVTTADAATGRMAKTIGMSTRELSAWQGAIKQIGGTAESATGGITGMNDAVQQFLLTGELPALRVFNQLGVSLFNARGQVKDAGQMWLDIADAVKGMDPVRATALLKLLPGANQDMINFALQGAPAMRAYLQAAREAGVATKESAEAAAEYQKQLSRLEDTATDLGRTLLTYLSPAISSAFEGLAKFVKAWNTDPGSAEAAKTDEKFNGDVRKRFGTPPKWLRDFLVLDYWGIGESDYGGAGPPSAKGSSGLPIKPGAGSVSPQTQRLMDALSGVGGLNRVSALNDAYHGGQGAHGAGNALDVTVNDPAKSAAIAAAIRAKLAEMGISANVIDEYTNPSARATGGHIHVSANPSLGGFTPGAPAAAGAVTNSRSSVANSSSANTNIGTIVINDASGDPDRVASGISGALRRQSLTAPANFGQQ